MKAVNHPVFCALALACALVAMPSMALAKTIWVTKKGSDSNGCTNSVSDSCLTIQKGISLAVAGDTVNIARGKYVENSSTNPATKKCAWLDDRLASLCVPQSGTVDAPIIIRAAPGDEGGVVIDSEGLRVGLHTLASDYLQIKGLTFINSNTIGIAHWGQVQNAVPDQGLLGIGVVIEGNTFLNTTGPSGENVAAIGMWGSKDWIVRNNYINGVSVAYGLNASGIQAYGVINALIENNFITNVAIGVYWKDHFVKSVTDRGTWFESEIRYNLINAKDKGVLIGVKGSKTVEAGSSYIHHNIIYGLGNDGGGIVGAMSAAYGISAPLRIENNLIDGGGQNTTAIALDGMESAALRGNIFTRTALDLELSTYSDSRTVHLTESNFNIFDSSTALILDRYSSTLPAKKIYALSEWQASLDTNIATLAFDRPDVKSMTASSLQLFIDAAGHNYNHKAGSPALGIMPDGSNAGPYQHGDEIIGPNIPIVDGRPKPPKPE